MTESHPKLVPTDPTPRRTNGRVLWYDPVKGFGFVVEDANHEYHLLRRSALAESGLEHVWEGDRFEFESERRPKGSLVIRLLKELK